MAVSAHDATLCVDAVHHVQGLNSDRLVDVLTEAVRRRRWPAHLAAAALVRVAADPTTRSPMRLACPGPWWDEASFVESAVGYDDRGELDRLEARLLEADGRRVWAQQPARADLAQRGEALTRLNVARRACELLDGAELTACSPRLRSSSSRSLTPTGPSTPVSGRSVRVDPGR